MYSLKRYALRTLLIVECTLFFGFYVFGSRGLPALRALRNENKELVADIIALEADVAVVQKEIDEWHTYPFYTEKIAREELQLINPGDTVYFIK